MSDGDLRIVDIRAWIDRARRDPLAYTERQATEVVLAAVSSVPGYGSRIYLKGGVLMAVVYQSLRSTADLDFTTDLTASPDLPGTLRAALDKVLPATAARLGYPDLVLRVQSVKERPRPFGTPDTSFPALDVNISYAKRGTRAEEHLVRGHAPNVVHMEISFNEPIHAVELLRLGIGGPSLGAYALTELIAEKFRALLQQVTRSRYRRQDVYDIAHLAARFPPDEHERAEILASFLDKCAARGIAPTIDSMSDPRVIERARSEWDTMRQEVGELPDFDECFAKVDGLYRSLPWR
jgi:predicted nucleotidyltransferase component of viral defense system